MGSNSQKTVEYFSKALGEKTITRDSLSINRDLHNWKQGSSSSDQVMARALLTPDEMRRLDNDLCIIYEKGVKPIKAKKYYYFEYPTVKIAEKYPMNHNENRNLERGVWRKYNPYNPYSEEKKEDTKIESLEDLFDDETPIKEEKKTNTYNNEEQAPMLPQEEIEELPKNIEKQKEKTEVDIQKELEAKFDELFGEFEEEEKNKKNTSEN